MKKSKRQLRLESKAALQSKPMFILKEDMNTSLTLEENMLIKKLIPMSGTEIHNGVKIKGIEISLLDYIYGARMFNLQLSNALVAESALLKLNPNLKNKI